MQTYGVSCIGTGFIVYLGQADDPLDACVKATRDKYPPGDLGPFVRSWVGAPEDDDMSWLELAVYDVTGILEPNPDVDINDEIAHQAMNDDTFIDSFAARQLG